ncbi:FecR domain-containing protein [Chitinophaga sp.]|uniref:FecR family protein n=1 Tax=Chitinophaga sp. TaxID=1869181 RepID=UPI0031D95C91
MAQGGLNFSITDELLSKYFAGEALPEEAMAIDGWRASHADNEGLFNASWKAWNATSRHPYHLPDKEAVWKVVAPKSTKKVRYIPWLAAASLLTVITVLAAWLLFSQKTAYRTGIAGIQSLPDGSVAKIAQGSEISYAENFKGNTRTIKLKGSGDFDVTFDPAKPFVVETGPVTITVLGTSFHVAENDSLITVQVTSGKVSMEEKGKNIVISAGQMGYFHKQSGRLFLETYHFAFDNEQLGTIITRLSIAFRKKIIIKDAALAQLRISSIFDNKSLEYILEVITSTLNLKYTYLNADEISIEAEE